MNQNLSKIIQNSHATIVEVPRGYGFDFAKKQIEFPAEAEIIDFLPQIHTGQKTEIINADDILEIQQKIRGKNSRQQFIIFHSAEKMNEQAQNKFLKSLEEPRSNLHFVLLANSAESFLPTVRSRSQIAKISPISDLESLKILKKFKLDETKTRQILFLANGLPAELEKLAGDKKYFAQKLESVEMAKKWLAGSAFEKLTLVGELKNDREKALDFIEQILKILQISTNEKTFSKTIPDAKKLLLAYRRIKKNGNIRLNLLQAILQ